MWAFVAVGLYEHICFLSSYEDSRQLRIGCSGNRPRL